MILEDYKSSILEMSYDDAFALIMEIRRNRRISKKPIKTASTQTNKKQGELMLDNITPDMAAMLLARLQEGGK